MPAPAASVLPSDEPDAREEFAGRCPVRLDPAGVRRLSRLSHARSLGGIAVEWLGVAAAVAFCEVFWHPAVYLLAVAFIGARQHALAQLIHEASHYRVLRGRAWNDAVADFFCGWPVLLTTRWFRAFHWRHHSHLGGPGDGNRGQYRTHTPDGELTPLWVFPKSPWSLAALLLSDLAGPLGLLYVATTPRRMLAGRAWGKAAAQAAYYAAVVGALVWAGWGTRLLLYWFVPLGTWYVMANHLRIMAEHSGLPESGDPFASTRTTLPTLLERLFFLPKNVNYHVEHHVHPSVPYYRLPELHRAMAALPGYAGRAHVTRTLRGVLRELVRQA